MQKEISIKEALNIASLKLSKTVSNPKREAFLLLKHHLNCEDTFLITNNSL
ncbi:MAG: hypothetical protein ACK5LP_00485, partial [Campylobacteraceae bacterium]